MYATYFNQKNLREFRDTNIDIFPIVSFKFETLNNNIS